MGSDIHIVLEKRTESGDWYGARDFSGFSSDIVTVYNMKLDHEAKGFRYVSYKLRSRDYAFFNDLCGVRGSGSRFGFTPRGLPKDASLMSQDLLSEDNPDLHSHSWLNMQELSAVLAVNKLESDEAIAASVVERIKNEVDEALLAKWVGIAPDEHNTNWDQWRLVFAFDN